MTGLRQRTTRVVGYTTQNPAFFAGQEGYDSLVTELIEGFSWPSAKSVADHSLSVTARLQLFLARLPARVYR